MTIYEYIQREESLVRIHGDYIKAKPYGLVEVWLNAGKNGVNHYFSINIDGQRKFVTVDFKTANDRRYYEPSIFGLKAMKVTCNGYIYEDERGYTHFAIKDLNNFTRV